MTLPSLSCPPTLRHSSPQFVRDYSRRDAALDRFHEGDHIASIREAIAFALPTVVTDGGELDLAARPLEFVQGSAKVRVAIVADQLTIASDIAELPASGKATAALRHMLTEVGSTGQYYQPRLYADTVRLEFSCPVGRLHPIKLIDAIEKLALEADRNDHWMSARFGVTMNHRALLSRLSPTELQTAKALWDAHWAGIEQLVSEVRRKRSMLLLEAVCGIASGHVRYLLPLQGELRRALEDDEDIYNDRDEHPDKRDAALAKAARRMRAVDAAALADGLGHAQYSVPTTNPERAPRISSVFEGEHWGALANAKAAGRSMDVTLALVAGVLTLLTRSTWPDAIATELRAALDIAHNKPWRDAAEPLFAHVAKLRRDYGDADSARDEQDDDFDVESRRREERDENHERKADDVWA